MSTTTDHKTIAAELKNVPGFQFIDHFAISVPQGKLDGQVAAYELLGFNEIHREEVHGKDLVREALDRKSVV
jgi:methylmalonyl-CoA/ethylmalonyl-CoA epimerase